MRFFEKVSSLTACRGVQPRIRPGHEVELARADADACSTTAFASFVRPRRGAPGLLIARYFRGLLVAAACEP